MKQHLFIRWLWLGMAGFLLWGNLHVLDRIHTISHEGHLFSRNIDDAAPPEYILVSSLLGSFRGLFITGLWIRAQSLKEQGKYYEMIDLYKLIQMLQPSHAAAWGFQAWDLAFNVSVEQTHDYQDRVFWVFRGIDLLRKEGIPKNQNIPHLYRELAYIFQVKLAGITDFAHPLYRAHLANQVNQVLLGVPPEAWTLYGEIAALLERYPTREAFLRAQKAQELLQKILAEDPKFDVFQSARTFLTDPPEFLEKAIEDPAFRQVVREAGLWQVGKDLRSELGMDAKAMFDICERFGPVNWQLPESHMLYWGFLGQELQQRLDPTNVDLAFQRIIYHALIQLVYGGDTLVSGEGDVFFMPAYQYVDHVIQYMQDTIAHYEAINQERERTGERVVSLAGVRAAYQHFLSNLALNAFLDEKTNLTKSLLERLKDFTGDVERYRVAPVQYVEAEIQERLRSMGSPRAISLMNAFYIRACYHLALGHREGYDRRNRWLETMHAYCLNRWNPKEREGPEGALQFEHRIPSLFELRKQLLLLIVQGRIPQFQNSEMVNRLMATLQSFDLKLYQAVVHDLKTKDESKEKLKKAFTETGEP